LDSTGLDSTDLDSTALGSADLDSSGDASADLAAASVGRGRGSGLLAGIPGGGSVITEPNIGDG
jgi:hypothetical protein